MKLSCGVDERKAFASKGRQPGQERESGGRSSLTEYLEVGAVTIDKGAKNEPESVLHRQGRTRGAQRARK